jgi:hypothetical protein
MSFIDFSELIKSHKGVSTSDRQDCGNIIGERGESIIVERDVMKEHIYVIPKSKIQGYDGARLLLNLSEAELKSFEEKRENNRESIGDTGNSSGIKSTIYDTMDKVKETAMGVKDKVVDTTKDVAGKTKDVVTPDSNHDSNSSSTSSSGQNRQYEEGYAGTDAGRDEDPLTEYREKEAMTPAKIKEHEPTAVKRDPNDQRITKQGQTGTDSAESSEQYRKRGMTNTSDSRNSDVS